ncbi:MAG: VanW family protein [Filifactoraceae bacterium]
MKKILFGVAGSILIGLAATGFYATTLTADNEILKNIYVSDINVGDMTKEEALKALGNFEKETGIEINLTYKEKNFNLDLSELGYSFNVKKAVDEAYETGRNQSLISNMMTTLSQELLGAEEKIEPPLELINDKYDEFFDKISPEIELPVKNASISVESGNIIITEGLDGVIINRDELKNQIKDQIESKKLFRADQETSYRIEIPVKIEAQAVKADSLKKVTGIIGEFTTGFNAGNKGRGKNISLAASHLNNKIINPGETLSYNNTIGEVNYKNGYMDDTVIVNGEIEQGVGGGVCQVSSTLYNAALYGGMEIVQRRNHSVPSNYTPIARDAVIFHGSIDLVIKNPYDYPIVIKAGTNNGNVTVQIYGNVETVPKVTLNSEVIGRKGRGVTYIDDPNLEIGVEKVKSQGRDEVRGVLYKTVNGVTTTVSTDVYPAKNKVVIRGIKPVANKEASVDDKSQISDDAVGELIGE